MVARTFSRGRPGRARSCSTRSRMVGRAAPKRHHALVLGLVADLAPAGVVAALLAAAGVASGGLEVAVGDGADPDIGPGGRDDERLDAGEGRFVAQGSAFRREIAEGLSAAFAADAGAGVGDVAEACCFSRLLRVRDKWFRFGGRHGCSGGP